MIRFTLMQLLMGMALFGIVLGLIFSDGCGPHVHRISHVEFSPDGTQLAVARHDARDANVPGKGYLRDVSRTISLYDAAALTPIATIDQQLLPGDRGPAFDEFRYAGPSFSFLSNDALLVAEFDGRSVIKYELDNRRWRGTKTPMGPALVVGTDSARTVVATAQGEEVSLWEAKSGRRLRRFITPEMPFLGAPLIAVSPDASATVTAGYSGVVIWDGAAAGKSFLLVPDEENTHIKAVAFSQDDEVLVADRFSLRFVDLVGRIRNENVPGDDILGVRLSPDGNSIVVVFREQAEILDRKTFKRLCTLQGEYVRAAAFSPDSKFIAGATKGKVGIWDARSGDLLRTARPPGRYRPPWTLPATALVVWLLACWQISKRGLARRTGIEAK